MIDDATLHVLLPAVSVIFTAGGFYIYVRLSLRNLEANARDSHKDLDEKINKNHETLLKDISGIGMKVANNERDASRRYHNTSLGLLLVSPPKDETRIAGLLKEEN